MRAPVDPQPAAKPAHCGCESTAPTPKRPTAEPSRGVTPHVSPPVPPGSTEPGSRRRERAGRYALGATPAAPATAALSSPAAFLFHAAPAGLSRGEDDPCPPDASE